VLALLTDRDPPLDLPHIAENWWDNVLMKRPARQ
jgi:hypothetical protein